MDNILSCRKIQAAWRANNNGFPMNDTQKLMLRAIKLFQSSPIPSEMYYNCGIIDILQCNLGCRSGATTLLKAIKDSHPEVFSISATLEMAKNTGLDYGCFYSVNSTKPDRLLGQTVIFDGALFWYPRKFVEMVRESRPRWIMSFGS